MNMIWGSEREPDLNGYLWRWASMQLFGGLDGFGPCTTMGVFAGPELIAVVVYHNMCRRSMVMELSAASLSPRWLTRPVLKEMFEYPFLQLGCQMVVLRVSEKDKRLARILTAYGFESYTIRRLRGRNEDEIVYTLTDDDWRNNRFQRKVIESGKIGSIAA